MLPTNAMSKIRMDLQTWKNHENWVKIKNYFYDG